MGAIQHELLRAGAEKATSVDASTAYIEASKQEAGNQGHEERVTYHHGDFIDIAPSLDPADIVTLDRVICCYHDAQKLVEQSSRLATELYGLVYPRGNLVSKVAFRCFNFMMWLRRSPFRIFIHSDEVIDGVVRANGLQRRFYRKTLVWQIMVYGRGQD